MQISTAALPGAGIAKLAPMKLRTRLDIFGATLLSALGAGQVACGGRATFSVGAGGAAGGSSGVSGSSNTGGANTAGSDQSGAATAGALGEAGRAGSSAGAGSGQNHFPCTTPQDLGHGFIRCEGFTHRQEVETCPSRVPRRDAIYNPVMIGTCIHDADCTDKPYGICQPGIQLPQTYCDYGCVVDSDCGENQLCECAEPVGRCVSAGCKSDADCASGFLCKGYDASGGCAETTYTCESAVDTCGSDLDCSAALAQQGLPQQNLCRFDAQASRFQCSSGSCAIGRPFLVGGAERLAPLATREDWSEPAPAPSTAALPSTLRARLAERWAHIARMEHGSIAAFARFALQLLSLGAPAELVERATSAMADETRHAKACFAIASSYATAPLGPGQLVLSHCLDESSLRDIVLNTIREGCVGETVAAVEAREAAEHVADPALRALLLSISDDETRHAELAYRFVQWALGHGDRQLERAVRAEFAAQRKAGGPAARGALTDLETELLRHGIVPDTLRRAIRAQTMAEVIMPCSRALFGSEAAAPGLAL